MDFAALIFFGLGALMTTCIIGPIVVLMLYNLKVIYPRHTADLFIYGIGCGLFLFIGFLAIMGYWS